MQDAKYIDEVQYAVTSRFSSQTGSVSTFPASNLVSHAIFQAKGFFWMLNTILKSKMLSLPVLLAKQEVPALLLG